MKKLTLLKALALAAGCAALASAGIGLKAGTVPANAANLVANSGTTFVLTPTLDPSVATIAADGVVQVSLLGNCTEHADLVVTFPSTSGQAIAVTGSATFKSANGTTTLKCTVEGLATPDPANPAFFNVTYHATFVGGSGAFASATGNAEINELVVFTSPLGGRTTWTMKGYVVSVP